MLESSFLPEILGPKHVAAVAASIAAALRLAGSSPSRSRNVLLPRRQVP